MFLCNKMQQNGKQSVCQLNAEGVSNKLTVKVNWHKNYFDLTIFDGVKAFAGTMKVEEIAKIVNQLGALTTEDYFKECKAALTDTNGCEDFVYIISDHLFQWKKKVDSDTKIMFGSIQLSVLPVVETLHDMLNVLVMNNHRLEQTASHLNEEKSLLEKDYKELLQRIDECVNIKNDIETELYSQFLVVLNTKKKRILQLEKLLKANKIDVKNVSVEEEQEVTKNTITDLYECDTEVESDNDNTDDDSKESARKFNLETPRKKSGIFDSDSDEATLICDIPKRRKRSDKDVVDESETLFISGSNLNQSESKVIIEKKSSSRSLHKRGTERNNCVDEGAGPSGLKISKVVTRKNLCGEQDETSSPEHNETKVDSSAKLNNDELQNQAIVHSKDEIETPSNTGTVPVKAKSSIDDILAGLIG